MAVPMIIRLGIHVSPTITSDPAHATLHVYIQQIDVALLLSIVLHLSTIDNNSKNMKRLVKKMFSKLEKEYRDCIKRKW